MGGAFDPLGDLVAFGRVAGAYDPLAFFCLAEGEELADELVDRTSRNLLRFREPVCNQQLGAVAGEFGYLTDKTGLVLPGRDRLGLNMAHV